jgi:hypothetical protein
MLISFIINLVKVKLVLTDISRIFLWTAISLPNASRTKRRLTCSWTKSSAYAQLSRGNQAAKQERRILNGRWMLRGNGARALSWFRLPFRSKLQTKPCVRVRREASRTHQLRPPPIPSSPARHLPPSSPSVFIHPSPSPLVPSCFSIELDWVLSWAFG